MFLSLFESRNNLSHDDGGKKNWVGQRLKSKRRGSLMRVPNLSSSSRNGSVNGRGALNVEWKEGASKWWKRESSWTVALANVFPGCSRSEQTPGPLMLSLTDHYKDRKKEGGGGLSAVMLISIESRQGHTLFQPLRCFEDADACMAVLIKQCCGEICKILMSGKWGILKETEKKCNYDAGKQRSPSHLLNNPNSLT